MIARSSLRRQNLSALPLPALCKYKKRQAQACLLGQSSLSPIDLRERLKRCYLLISASRELLEHLFVVGLVLQVWRHAHPALQPCRERSAINDRVSNDRRKRSAPFTLGYVEWAVARPTQWSN